MFKLLPLVSLVAACFDEPIEDYGDICVESVGSGSQYALHVTASSSDCSSDHSGVAYSCEATLSRSTVTVSTHYVPGRDKNDSCAGPIFAACGLNVEAGSYTLSFGGEDVSLEIPVESATCIPEGSDSGW